MTHVSKYYLSYLISEFIVAVISKIESIQNEKRMNWHFFAAKREIAFAINRIKVFYEVTFISKAQPYTGINT